MSGVSNELELEFAKYLSNIGKPIWIRQVLIPGITDNKEDLLKLKEFISSLNNVEKVELLPYHDLGKFKWQQLGLEYPTSSLDLYGSICLISSKNKSVKSIKSLILSVSLNIPEVSIAV